MHKNLLLVLLFLLSTAVCLAQPATYRLNKMMGTPVGFPSNLPVNHSGPLCILDGGNITTLDSTGRYLATLDLTAGSTARWCQALGVDGGLNQGKRQRGNNCPSLTESMLKLVSKGVSLSEF